MQTGKGYLCLTVALVVLRLAAAEQRSHQGAQRFSTALRIQARESPSENADAPSKDAGSSKHQETAEPTSNQTRKYRLPKYVHADSLSAATNGYVDWFVVSYWGSIIILIAIFEAWSHLNYGTRLWHAKTDADSEAASPAKALDTASEKTEASGTDADETPIGHQLSRRNTTTFLLAEGPGVKKDLAPNVWALNLVSSVGRAKDRHGNLLCPKFVFAAGICMGVLQLLTLFLVVYDIDPSASPYTEMPSASWKTSALTVNTMKVIMVFFLGMYVVSEAADAYDNYLLACAVDEEQLQVHKFFVLFTPMFHYFITLSVILAGVSVVLSCQDVPNILYNSMAILFITRVDELFWGFFERTFDIEADWVVEINENASVEVQLLKKCIIMFPMMWGFCLLGRAWYRVQMPMAVMRIHFHD